jgi:Tol biopolymer transport system component/DNA-binding winged helix-turn-helix (wHTH) protein
MIYRFDSFILNPSEKNLLKNGLLVPLTPRSFDILLTMVRSSGALVKKDDFFKQIWSDTNVEESNITHHIYLLRKALGTSPTGRSYIETVPKRGYRFVGEVFQIEEIDGAARGPSQVDDPRDSDKSLLEPAAPEAQQLDGIPSVSRGDWVEPQEGLGHEQEEGAHSSADAGGERGGLNFPVSVPRHDSSSPRPRRRKVTVIVLASGLCALALTISGIRLARRYNTAPETVGRFEQLNISKITSLGDVIFAAISPDGKFVAYVRRDKELFSIRVRQADRNSDIQVLPPQEVRISGFVISPDEQYIFYTGYEKNGRAGSLYQVPFLGGAPKQVFTNIDSIVGFSPDGQHLAYIRGAGFEVDSSLVVTDLDGRNEQILSSRKSPQFFDFEGAPAWSPDGRSILCSVGDDKASGMKIVELEIGSHQERVISPQTWGQVEQIVWVSDGSGIIIAARAMTADATSQLWRVSLPSGEVRRLTNDLNNYYGLSVSADSRTLVTVQITDIARVFTMTLQDVEHHALSSKISNSGFADVFGVSWTPDGKILYAAKAQEGSYIVYHTDAAGRDVRQLAANSGSDFFPRASPDGHRVAFVSTYTGAYEIWVMDIDGNNRRQLTNDGDSKVGPNWTPDGRWIVYTTQDSRSLWKVEVETNEKVRLAATPSFLSSARVSPDGKFIAIHYFGEKTGTYQLAVMTLRGAHQFKSFAQTSENVSLDFEWSKDGKALYYIDKLGGVLAVMRQPLSGGPPKKVVDLSSDDVRYFALSTDSRRIVYVDTITSYDAIKIADSVTARK